jgi:hypothetical protein
LRRARTTTDSSAEAGLTPIGCAGRAVRVIPTHSIFPDPNVRTNVPNRAAPVETNTAAPPFLHRLSYDGRTLLEGYLVPTHYDRLFSTCLRDYTTDHFVTNDRTDRSIIEAISAALSRQHRAHRIDFNRTMRHTNGRPNGFCGLPRIAVSVFELREREAPTAKITVLDAMAAVGSDLDLPLTYLNKESVVQRGGATSWDLTLQFRCMPNLRGQTRV